MNAAVFVTILVTLIVIAAIMLLLPAMMPPTVPMGVNVPVARQDEPVIRSARHRYFWMIGAAWLLAVVVLVALVFVSPVAAAIVSTLLFVVGTAVAYIVARQAIVRAKHEGQWYKGVQVRLVGSVTVDPVHAPVPAGWFAASLLLLAIAAAIGVGVYDSLPAQVPVHWGAGGAPDRYAEKSIWAVFGPLIIGGIVLCGIFALSFLNRVVPVRGLPSAEAEQNVLRARAIRSAVSALLGRLMFVITLTLAWISVVSWLLPESHWAVSAGTLVMLALILLVLVLFLVRWGRIIRSGVPKPAASKSAADAPDDDRFWKAGIFYVNPDDPSIMVPRRFGVGWTINLGHPAGIAICVALLVVLLGIIVFAMVSRAPR
ncbi:DUF1648 domain-containing protein [Planctomonas sp. JC2975]|uniref:DUF5808 domain-containing protein n=1 Tax=Planctomonas sp. JC2975 TaxID=2729626 RepID=UPI001475974B|nr:DUF5808 domain-containing protein [Planctomonas sp. JC2975]NNC11309.1 DUF1648 domain-containing protein [Planctomonas sp. JC2975]